MCPLVVHYWADLQLVHGFRCYDNTHICKLIALYTANAYSTKHEMSASACTHSMAGFPWYKGMTPPLSHEQSYSSYSPSSEHVRLSVEHFSTHMHQPSGEDDSRPKAHLHCQWVTTASLQLTACCQLPFQRVSLPKTE